MTLKSTVTPLQVPSIDWNSFLRVFKDAGKRPAAKLDAAGIETGSLESYLLVLYYAQGGDLSPREAIKQLGQIRNHLFFSFMVYADENVISELYRRVQLSTLSLETSQHHEITVVSGTLTHWHAALLEFCSLGHSQGVRELFDAFLLWFERAGLRSLWKDYRKVKQNDSTFTLEKK